MANPDKRELDPFAGALGLVIRARVLPGLRLSDVQTVARCTRSSCQLLWDFSNAELLPLVQVRVYAAASCLFTRIR